MAEEGKDDVEKIQPDTEGKIPAGKDGKYPEVVPWSQYVGIKESLGNKLDAERTKVTSLEEQLKKGVSTEEHDRIKTELDTIKTQLQTKTTELETNQAKTLLEKRDALVKRGVSEDKVKELSEKEIDAVLTVEIPVPRADMAGGGGGGGSLGDMSPAERAKEGDKRLREANK